MTETQQRVYEVIWIARPETTEEEIDKLIAQFEPGLGTMNSQLEKVEKWGVRKLAYHVRKNREGYYVYFVVRGSGEAVRELERRFKVTDAVIKYLTVRVDEEWKRLEKKRREREKKAARRPRPAAPASAPEAPAPPAA